VMTRCTVCAWPTKHELSVMGLTNGYGVIGGFYLFFIVRSVFSDIG
jgi:hypothetical protein